MKKSLFALGLVSAAVISACSGGGGGDSTAPSISELLGEKVKENPQQATKYANFIASSTAKVISVLSGIRSSDDLPVDSDLLKPFLQPDKMLNKIGFIIREIETQNGTQSCDDGGTWTITTNPDGSKLVTFNDCQIYDLKINGTMDYSEEDKNGNNIPEKINAVFHKGSTIELVDDKEISVTEDITIPDNTVVKIVNNNIPFTITGNLTDGDIYKIVNNKVEIDENVSIKNSNLEVTTKKGDVYNLTNEEISGKVVKTETLASSDLDIKNLVVTDQSNNRFEQNFGIKSEVTIDPTTHGYKKISLTLKKGKIFSLTYNNSTAFAELENDLNLSITGKFENGNIVKMPTSTPASQDNNLPDIKADIVIDGGYLNTSILGSNNNFKFENFTVSVDTEDNGTVDRQFSINGKIYVDQTTCIMDRYFVEFSTEKPFVLSEDESCPHDGKLNIGNAISITAYNAGTENHLKAVFDNQTLFDSKCEDISVQCFSSNNNNNGG